MQSYVGWDELDDRDRPITADGVAGGAGVPGVDGAADPVAGWEALEALLKERSKVEQHLRRLLGQAPPDAADARETARFPLPMHTAETRMADRKAAREEERARAAARRSMERLRLQAQEEQDRVDRKRQAEAAALALEAQRLAEAKREAERQEERRRMLLVEELLRGQWAAQRAAALEASHAAREAEWNHFADRIVRGHARARTAITERRTADRKLLARFDARSRKRRTDDPLNPMNRPLDRPLDRPRRADKH